MAFSKVIPFTLKICRHLGTYPHTINFCLSEKQKQVQSIVKKFAAEDIIPNAAYHDETGEFPTAIIKKAWSLGIMNGCIPQKLGGSGYDILTCCIIAEELAYGCIGMMAPIAVSNIGQIPVIYAGTDIQKKKFLGRLLDEPLLTAYCVTEPDCGSDVNGIKTYAKKLGDEYILNGRKMWITNAGVANWYFVLARTNQQKGIPANKAFTAFVIERDTPGIHIGRKEWNMGQRASDTRGITFEDVRIPKDNIIGTEGNGFKIAMSTFNKTRPLVAAGAVGLSNRCLNESLKYSIKNNIYSDQSIAFMLADMAIAIEIGRLAYQKATWCLDNSTKAAYYASIAKCYTADFAVKIASDSIQIFGLDGLSKFYPVEKLLRDAKILQIYEGTSQIQRLIISKEILQPIN